MGGIKKMFMPDMPAVPPTPALPLPTEPESWRNKRMPLMTDPDILAAAQRTRAAALKRTGRLSTILTDQTKAATGTVTAPTSDKLGA
jgi:hypothetical protein